MNTTATARIDMAKLQILNDRICQTLDALNQVRLTAHSIVTMPTMNPYLQNHYLANPYMVSPYLPQMNPYSFVDNRYGFQYPTGYHNSYAHQNPIAYQNSYAQAPGFNTALGYNVSPFMTNQQLGYPTTPFYGNWMNNPAFVQQQPVQTQGLNGVGEVPWNRPFNYQAAV